MAAYASLGSKLQKPIRHYVVDTQSLTAFTRCLVLRTRHKNEEIFISVFISARDSTLLLNCPILRTHPSRDIGMVSRNGSMMKDIYNHCS